MANEFREFPLIPGNISEEVINQLPFPDNRRGFIKQAATIVEYWGANHKSVLGYPTDFLAEPLVAWFKNLPGTLTPETLPGSYQRFSDAIEKARQNGSVFMQWYEVLTFGISVLNETFGSSHPIVMELLSNPAPRPIEEIVAPSYLDRLRTPRQEGNRPAAPRSTQPENVLADMEESIRFDQERGLLGEMTIRELRQLSPDEQKAVVKYVVLVKELVAGQTKRAIEADPTRIIAKHILIGSSYENPFRFYNLERLMAIASSLGLNQHDERIVSAGIFLTAAAFKDRTKHFVDALKQPDLDDEQQVSLMQAYVDLLTEIVAFIGFMNGKVDRTNVVHNTFGIPFDSVATRLSAEAGKRILNEIIGLRGLMNTDPEDKI